MVGLANKGLTSLADWYTSKFFLKVQIEFYLRGDLEQKSSRYPEKNWDSHSIKGIELGKCVQKFSISVRASGRKSGFKIEKFDFSNQFARKPYDRFRFKLVGRWV